MALNAQDCEEIRQHLARYNFAIDLGDTAGWAETFTPDGVFECVGLPADSPLAGRYQGRDALQAYAQVHFGIHRGRARHWNWNLVMEGDGSRATMRCYLNAYTSGGAGGPKLRATGVYEDVLRKADGRWLFESRRIAIDPA